MKRKRPKHRLCMRPRHHDWVPTQEFRFGWRVFICRDCLARDI